MMPKLWLGGWSDPTLILGSRMSVRHNCVRLWG